MLHLNLPKTVLIPLWEAPPERVRSEIIAMWPELERLEVEVGTWSRYLGFAVGPGQGVLSWVKPCDKVTERVRSWNWGDLQYSVVAYNTYIASVWGFVAQLEDPPPAVCV